MRPEGVPEHDGPRQAGVLALGAKRPQARRTRNAVFNFDPTVVPSARNQFAFHVGEPIFEAKFGLPASECRALVTAMTAEFEEYHPTTTFKVALGRRQ